MRQKSPARRSTASRQSARTPTVAAARPGDKVTATGTSFGGGGCGCRPRGVSPVEVHWNGRNGPVVAEANADTVGNISATFSVPDAKPGYYTIVATQRDLELNMDYYGTPAIASFEVLGPHGESVVRPSSEGVGSGTNGSDSAGLVALTVALGVLHWPCSAGALSPLYAPSPVGGSPWWRPSAASELAPPGASSGSSDAYRMSSSNRIV